jgi:preprotein translocase subunit SecA
MSLSHILSGLPIETRLAAYEAPAEASLAFRLGGHSDEALLARSRALRAAFPRRGGEVLPLCLALASEACRRRLGLDPYATQLVVASVLASGRVAQVQTGEGKTLAAALAAAFCAMRDTALHVITANDYLARRDAEWMRPIYEALGLSVASIAGADGPDARALAYRADVLYLTARELGFDYLRDGLACEPGELVQRGFNSAIVDEADFILVDEARIPLVIAGDREGTIGEARSEARSEVEAADAAARALLSGQDFCVDPEGRKVSLSLEGRERAAALLGSGGMHTFEGAPLFARLHAALHARNLLERDVDYIVREGRIHMVDGFTGRVAEARRWPWGVHAALEAKEGLSLQPEGRIFGSIAVQHLMGLYPRLAAMTATALPAAAELASAYGLETVLVPPRLPSRRRDAPDAVFADRASKMAAIIDEVAREHERGRPVLIGTASVRESEELAQALGRAGLECVLLNAKNDAEEARLISMAGRRGAITVSTNMAGRGTDIRLADDSISSELGGLCVIGTNHHESRRIDDQLRGRAARQGDPGLTRFYASLEDPLFRRYGERTLLPKRYRSRPELAAGPIEDPAVAREIMRAQAIIEGENSAIRLAQRKYSLLVEYDRRCVRQLRDEALLRSRLPTGIEGVLAGKGFPPALAGAATSGERKAMVLAFLGRLDAVWADHLDFIEDLKEGLALLRYGGKEPGIEFVRAASEAFEAALRRLEEESLSDCLAILRGKAASPTAARLRPASTWTYEAREDEIPGFGDSLSSLFRAR